MPTPGIERRESVRHPLAVEVTLNDAHSWTRDVSASGVFFTLPGQSSRPPALREHIRFRLTLDHVDPHGPLSIDCEGEVVRVEVGPAMIGVAARISAYDFGASEVPSPHE
jgi:PilZ domain